MSTEDANADPTSCTNSNDMNNLVKSTNVKTKSIICLESQEAEVEDDLALLALIDKEDK